jgi:hypothetical protein
MILLLLPMCTVQVISVILWWKGSHRTACFSGSRNMFRVFRRPVVHMSYVQEQSIKHNNYIPNKNHPFTVWRYEADILVQGLGTSSFWWAQQNGTVFLVLTWYCVNPVSALIAKMYQISNSLDNNNKRGRFITCIVIYRSFITKLN